MNKLALAILLVVMVLVVIELVKACLRTRGSGDRATVTMENAKRDLVREAPIGSSFGTVVDVLKRQGYDSNWTMDSTSKLTAIKNNVLREFDLDTGPTRWQLRIYCYFADGKLHEVQTEMSPDSL